MTVRDLKEILKGIKEGSTTGTGASFSAGQGEQYASPRAFGKVNTKALTNIGFKKVSRPKHPSHTKMFDYLEQ